MILLPTFEERLEYLRLNGQVAGIIFGGHRYVNQSFYRSKEWKTVRRKAIIRDNGCDLGDPDRPIYDHLYIHHIEPITIDDLTNVSPKIFDLDNLICVSFDTHQAIHYGRKLPKPPVVTERQPNDMAPWKL